MSTSERAAVNLTGSGKEGGLGFIPSKFIKQLTLKKKHRLTSINREENTRPY